jgi:hypothetical protein
MVIGADFEPSDLSTETSSVDTVGPAGALDCGGFFVELVDAFFVAAEPEVCPGFGSAVAHTDVKASPTIRSLFTFCPITQSSRSPSRLPARAF